MMALLTRALPYLISVALLLSIWSMWRTIATQKDMINAQSGAITQLIENVDSVVELNRGQVEGIEMLLAANSQVQLSLNERQQEIRRLQSDVQEIRIWADQSLPADIVRLRERPAARGAANYAKPVPTGSALRDAGGESTNERRLESGTRAN